MQLSYATAFARSTAGKSPDVAGAHHALARAMIELDQPDSAVYHVSLAVRIYKETVGAENWRVADCLTTSGQAHLVAHRYEAAEAELLEARRIYAGSSGAADGREAATDSLLSALYVARSRELDEASRAGPDGTTLPTIDR